jgi:hypothetical protein
MAVRHRGRRIPKSPDGAPGTVLSFRLTICFYIEVRIGEAAHILWRPDIPESSESAKCPFDFAPFFL